MSKNSFGNAEPLLSNPSMALLGLRRQPFVVPKRVVDLFDDSILQMQMKALCRYLHDDSSLLVLRGEEGSGKSCLLVLLTAFDRNADYFIARVRGALSAEKLLTDMLSTVEESCNAQDISDEHGGWDAPLLERLARSLQQEVGDGGRAVLLVDDADRLKLTALKRLLQYVDHINTLKYCHLNLLLAGGREIEIHLSQISSENLHKGQVISYPMRRLTRARAREYLRHRLRRAGYRDQQDLPWQEQDLMALVKRSGGVPSQLDRLCVESLERQAEKERPAQLSQKRRWHQKLLAQRRWVWNLAANKRLLRSSVLVVVVLAGLLPVMGWLSERYRQADGKLPLATTDNRMPWQKEAATWPAVAPEGQNTIKRLLSQQVKKPVFTVAAVTDSSARTDVQEALGDIALAAEKNTVTGRRGGSQSCHLSWLKHRPEQHYTLQIAAGQRLDLLLQFADSQGLARDRFVWCFQRKQEKEWFMLLYGDYPDMESAQRAKSSLPAAFSRLKPWIRSFRSVQQSYR